MSTPNLSNLGNLREEYSAPKFKSDYLGLWFDNPENPGCAIKNYALIQPGREKDLCPGGLLAQLLRKRIDTGEVSIELGLGFLVSSEGVINLSLWRKDFPHLPRQTIWVCESGIWKRADLNQDNSYCIGEGAIYSFERNAWQKFLESEKGEKRKKIYLGSVFRNGPISS